MMYYYHIVLQRPSNEYISKKKIITIQIKNHQVNTLCGRFLLTLRQKVSSDPLHATVHTSTAAPSEYSFRIPLPGVEHQPGIRL